MDCSFRAYCRTPEGLKGRQPEGGCPQLLYDLFSELEGAEEIHIAAYLFNNPIYAEFLIELAKNGCKIHITSLPIHGYSPKKLAVNGYNNKVSGREMAELIYEKLVTSKNIELRIFPHMYIWYGALYADGGASYSFHVKAIIAKFHQTKKCILSSGNFMFSDPLHSDNIIVIEGENEYSNTFEKFMNDTERNSILFDYYKNTCDSPEDDFKFSLYKKEDNLLSKDYTKCFFTAPYYFFDGDGSNHYAGRKITDHIALAKKRIWVCAQHFHDVLSFDQASSSIIKAIYEKSNEEGVEFRFLKQVPHSSLSDKRRAAIAETLFQYVLKAAQRYNRLTHDKFIIVDDTLIISTANYTSTQFAFAPREMEMTFAGEGTLKKRDYFSEVNGFVIIPNCDMQLLSQYEDHFNKLWDNGIDIRIDL